MPVQPIRVEYTSSGSAITFGSTFDVFSTGVRSVNWDSGDSTLGKVAGVLGLEASLNLDYNFDLDAFWEVSIGENELDLWYDIFLAYDEHALVADGESYVLDTGSWFVQDMALSDVGTTNKGSIEAGLEYDVLLDLNEAEVSALGGTASFAPDDPLINIVDARSLLIGGSIEDGQVDFYGAIGDQFLSGREYETEGEYDITAVPGASITWDFDNDLTVENTISGTEDILASGRDLTWQNFSFTQESEDNDNFIGLNFDLDAILQTLGLLPPNPLSPNPLTSVFDYSYDGKFLWREVGLAVELLDVDLNLGLELERIVSFDQTSSDIQILSDGNVVGSGTLGSQIAFAPDVSLGESQDYEIVASVSGTYTQSYGISINLTPIIQVLRAEIGLGRTILDYNDTNELVSTVSDPLFEYDGVDLVELLKELEIIESNDLFSSGFIEVYSVENEITLTSDGSDDFSITAIDGSQALEEPPELSEVANAGNASAGFELVGIDVNGPDYNPEEQSGAQTYFVDGIYQSKQIYSGNGTAWIQAGGSYPRLAFLYSRGDDGFDFIQNLGDVRLVNDALLSLAQGGSYKITGFGSSSYRTISFQHYTNAYNPGSDAPVENININGSDLGDTIFYYGGTQYLGGGGLDGFAANWRDQSEGVSWSLVTNETTTLANGVTVGEFELVHLLLGSGNDAVTGGNSFDYLDGGAGNDTLAGGRGNDILIGGAGNDVIEGGAGRDTINGGVGDDVILDTQVGILAGGAGNDRFYVHDLSNGSIDGGSGTDTAWIVGGGVNAYGNGVRSSNGTVLEGGLQSAATINTYLQELADGATYIITQRPGSASYTYSDVAIRDVEEVNVDGSVGSDLIVYKNGTQYFGGAGSDRFVADWQNQSAGVTWSLATTNPTTLANGVTVGGFERAHLLLGSGDDAVTGGDSTDYLDGGAGNDTLAGSGGLDVLIGGEGNDVIEGGAGRDTINGGVGDDVILDTQVGILAGGAGNDRFYVHDLSNGSIDGGSGTDTAWIVGGGVNAYGNGVRSSNGTVLEGGLQSAATINTYLQELADGATYIITQRGGSYSHLYYDVAIRDVEEVNVDGGVGSDLIVYKNGTQYFGGAGSDRFVADWQNQSAGVTWSLATTNPTTLANGVTVGGFERAHLLLGSGDDVVTGGNMADYINGGVGDDTLKGGSGNDYLIGGGGNDVILGGNGSDTIDGQGSDDIIIDTGKINASGGTGNDLFYVSRIFERSIIDGGEGDDTAYFQSDDYYYELGVQTANGNFLRYPTENHTLTEYLLNLADGLEQYVLAAQGTSITVTFSDVEKVNVKASKSYDLVVYYGGTQYAGGLGSDDRFAANWRDQAVGVSWSLETANTITLENNVTVDGFERVHLLLGSGDDAVTGGHEYDFLDGGGGNDTLAGGSGNDVLIGGEGNDVIEGGGGEDSVIFTGTFGVDVVYNSSGWLSAEFDDPSFSALLFSRSDMHLMVQVAGTDNIAVLVNYFTSEYGWDISLNGSTQTIIPASIAEGPLPFEVAPLLGTISNDQITLTAADTAVQAGNGNDVVVSGSVSHKIDGGSGQDLIDYSASAQGVTVNLGAGLGSSGDATGDTYVSIENVVGSSNSDSIVGSGADNFVSGESGNDIIHGADGSDVLFGSDGNDYIYGGEFELRYALPQANQVFRLYQATFNRAPDETGHKRWTSDLFTGEATLADVREGFVGSQEFRNKYAAVDNATFIKQMYINVLDRDFDQGEVTQTEIDNWTNRITDSSTRADVVNGFSESQQLINNTNQTANELAVNGNPASWSDDVYRLYQATLDRAPDNGGFANWSERLSEGRALIEVISGFTNSQEFAKTYGTLSDPEDFVKLLYNNVLGRDFDAGGVAQEEVTGWTSQLSDNFTRAHIVQGFSQSQEFRNNTAQDLKDWIRSQGIEDIIDGGSGDNVLSGGAMADTFLFDQEDAGTHTVLDLEPWDYVDLHGFGYANVADARAHMTQSGSSIQFADQGTVITFERATLVELGDDVFLL